MDTHICQAGPSLRQTKIDSYPHLLTDTCIENRLAFYGFNDSTFVHLYMSPYIGGG